jgi:4-amino-4-deoxy-L-arabinose transferase-like glycosyltransferase
MTARAALLVFVAALVLRLGYVGLVHDGTRSLLQPDSELYLTLGRDLIETGGFNRVTGLGVEPETERVPGYPAWIAAFRVVVGEDALWPVLGQATLDAATCVVIALLAARLDRRAALPAGLLAAVNLNMIAAAGVVLTDSLFLAVFALWLLAGVRLLQRPSVAGALGCGALLGLATLVRAATQFLPPVFALVVFWGAWRAGARPVRAAGLALLALMGSLAVTAPYALRNVTAYGHLALTSQGGTHALFWVVPAAREFAEGVPFAITQNDMALSRDRAYPARSANPFVESYHAMAVARAAMTEMGVVALARAWVSGAVINLAAPSVFAVPPVQRMERPSFYATPGDGLMGKLVAYVRATGNAAVLALLFGGAALTAATRLVQLVGLVAVRRRLAEPSWLFLLIVAAYVLAITGPVTGVKYRLPLEPILTVLMAYGLLALRPPWRARRAAGTRPATTPPTPRS